MRAHSSSDRFKVFCSAERRRPRRRREGYAVVAAVALETSYAAAVSGAKVLGGKGGLRVAGHGPLHPGHYVDELVGSLEVVGPASLASLRQGLLRWRPGRFEFLQVALVDIAEAKLARQPDNYRGDIEIRLHVHDGESAYSVFAATYGDPEDGLPEPRRVERLLKPFLERHRATASVSVDDDPDDYGGAFQLGVDISMALTGRTVQDAYDLASGALALLEAENGGELDRERTIDLLRGGRADVLLGQTEYAWMDFKREGYKKTDHDKFELAKDVAAFANADGGVLVLGIATVKSGAIETASAVLPCPPGSVSAKSYKATLMRRLHPPPEGIEIFAVPQGSGGDVWVVAVPPQPEEFKPFLVHGAVIDDTINDAYFSVVVRRGDDNLPTDPQAVHALMAAGRAALRMGPREPQ